MLVKILKRFVDDRGHMQAPGVIREVTESTGRRLIYGRRAVEVKAVPTTEPVAGTVEDLPEIAFDTLPVDFPERDRLLDAGITTVSQLRDTPLDEIEGVGPARRVKIQKALDALEV